MTKIAFSPLADAPGDDALLTSIHTSRGFVPNVFRVMLHSPGVTAGWVSLANSLRTASLDLRTRELAILLVAHLKRSEYEWGHHEPVALSAGVSAGEIAALRAWPDRAQWEPRDWATLSLVHAVACNEPIPDWSLSELQDDGAGFVVELAATAAHYVAVALFTTALQVPADEHETGESPRSGTGDER